LWVNGRFVSRGPARCFPHNQFVDCLDVTAHLQAGPNTLAVQVYQPGYSHFAYLFRGAAGLLLHLVCDGQTVLVTDQSWRTHRDPSFAADVPRVSIYSTGVEVRDLRLADDWINPAYVDSDWMPARVVAPVGGYPWTGLQLRSLPLLHEREIPLTLLETRRDEKHPATTQTDPHDSLRNGWRSAGRAAYQPDRDGWYSPSLAAGEAAYWLFDLERDHTCQGWIDIQYARGQEKLSLSYAEKIRAGELVLSDPETYCRVRLTDQFRLRAGNQRAEGFALRGGRYLLIHLTGPTGADFRFKPHVRISEYPLEVDYTLSAADPELVGIITLCEQTFRACLQDGFVDSTWRESSQWLGDALPQSLIMATMSNDMGPLRQVIEMAVQGAYPDGVLPSVLPGEVHAYAIVDYNFTWVELLHLYWELSRDEPFVQSMWPALTMMLDRFHQDVNAAGLIVSQPGRRLFLDWAPLSRNEPNAVYNLHYLLALQQAIRLAAERGQKSAEVQSWQSRAQQLKAAVRAAFWQNGLWQDDLEATTHSQLTAALAVLTETATPAEVDAQLEAIASRSLDMSDDPAPGQMVLASPFMHHYLFEALRQARRFEQVIDIIRRRWGRWVAAGYPTTWENWDVDFPDGSQCHAFSAHPRYHLAEIAREQGAL
jgi:hypothetical protein